MPTGHRACATKSGFRRSAAPATATTEQKGKLTAGFGASAAEIGPEFTFGIYMEKLLGEPILLIKTSWGGKESAY